MATDQKRPLFADDPEMAPPTIENELPTYRAISRFAVFSVIFGILASFTFASLNFMAFAILAIALGFLAHRAIKRYPDMYTGSGLANTGITLGLIFGLTAGTYTGVQRFILNREAHQFSQVYAKVLTEGDLGDALWYGLNPDLRKNKTPAEALREFEQAKTKEKMYMDQKLAPLQGLKSRLTNAKGAHLHFVDIEDQGTEETQSQILYYALALYEVEDASTQAASNKPQYALAIFKGIPKAKGKGYEWWVEDVKFPYERKSFAPVAAKPADDGHGHPH